MLLMRQVTGDVLRRARWHQGRTLREVSAGACVSLGYLSEVERGQKEASSELLAAICAALGVPLSVIMRDVSAGLAIAEAEGALAGVALTGVAGLDAAVPGDVHVLADLAA